MDDALDEVTLPRPIGLRQFLDERSQLLSRQRSEQNPVRADAEPHPRLGAAQRFHVGVVRRWLRCEGGEMAIDDASSSGLVELAEVLGPAGDLDVLLQVSLSAKMERRLGRFSLQIAEHRGEAARSARSEVGVGLMTTCDELRSIGQHEVLERPALACV